MISFEIDSSQEGIEVYLDSAGVDELIRYLNHIKEKNDHFHMLVGNELSDQLNQTHNNLLKHVKLIYIE